MCIRDSCYADQEMLIITTYLNDKAQTPLNRFVVYMLYSRLCNKYSDKSNRWNLGLSLSVASSTIRAISSNPSSTTLLISVNGVPWRIFYKSTVVHTKMGHVSKTTPLLKWFVITLARLNIVSLCTKFESCSFSHSWDMDGAPKI